MKKQSLFRTFAGWLHLWLGLFSGLFLFTICLTGTIYVFHAEIEEWLHPKLYKAIPPSANAKQLSPDEVTALLQKEGKGKVVSITIPEDKSRNWQAGILKEDTTHRKNVGATSAAAEPTTSPKNSDKKWGEAKGADKKPGRAEGGEKGGGAPRPENYFVNPYTGKIVGQEARDGFFPTVLKLHRWFLLPKSVGSVLGGVAVLMFVFITISGSIIWIPARLRHWKQGLTIKRKAHWKRTNYDLHKTLGFYAIFFCLLWALTGLNWSFTWYKDGASKVLGAKVFGEKNAKPMVSKHAGSQSLSLHQLLQIAGTQLPYPGTCRIQLPADSTGTTIIQKNKTGFFALSAADKLQLDAATGEVLKLEKFSDKKFNQKIAALIRPLHTGEIFGTFSKIVYFLMCLITTSLPVTGTIIWWNKRKQKNKKGKKIKRPAAAVQVNES